MPPSATSCHVSCEVYSCPYLGRKRPELGLGLRTLVSGDYVIVYQSSAEEVQVMRVVHGRRDLTALFPPESQ